MSQKTLIMLRQKFDTAVLFLSQQNVLCHDTKFFATSSFYTSASGNCRDKHFSFQLVYSVATGFLWFLHNFYHDRIFFCRDRDLCCDKLDSAHLSFHPISVTTEFSSIATKILSLSSFYCRNRKLLCHDKDYVFNFYYVAA